MLPIFLFTETWVAYSQALSMLSEILLWSGRLSLLGFCRDHFLLPLSLPHLHLKETQSLLVSFLIIYTLNTWEKETSNFGLSTLWGDSYTTQILNGNDIGNVGREILGDDSSGEPAIRNGQDNSHVTEGRVDFPWRGCEWVCLVKAFI